MSRKTLLVSDLKPNPINPRTIVPEKLAQLKQSLTDFPQMLLLRPIVVDENNVLLGGNMRLRALRELGIKEVLVHVVSGWTEEQKKEFIVKTISTTVTGTIRYLIHGIRIS